MSLNRKFLSSQSTPIPVAGSYIFPISPGVVGSSNTLGNSTLRVAPWLVTRQCVIDRIGIGVSVVGEAGSKFRLGIYADNGAAYPGALLLDAGQVAGDAVDVPELTVSLTLSAGLYWIGGAVQAAATTQPTIRTASGWHMPISISTGTSVPSSTLAIGGFTQASVTGALPSTFSTSLQTAGSVPRPFVRLA
jgi:hypothetical protein